MRRRSVYNSQNPNNQNSPNNQDSNQNDGSGGLPEGWQPRSPSPSDNLPPRLTIQELQEQQAIQDKINQENTRRFARPSNGQAGGAMGDGAGGRAMGAGAFERYVRPRTNNNPFNDNSGDIGFAGARGNQTIAEQIVNHAPLDKIISSQINNQNNDGDTQPPEGVDKIIQNQAPPRHFRPQQPIARPTDNPPITNYFGNRLERIEQAQERIAEVQERIAEAQQIVVESLQRAQEAERRVAEARQIASDLQRELAQQRAADLPRTASQITEQPQDRPIIEPQGEQPPLDRPTTPEPFPLRSARSKNMAPENQPRGGADR
jgi:hypothetical protein